ncbi:MAG TPA: hypothetical protein VKA15_17980 [Isosphaeraceae bacterium]|nr:hypothetical protein [Isosphaeraceae bacterium]
MARELDASPLNLDRLESIHAVREVLQRAGFDETHIAERLGVADMAALIFWAMDRPRLLHRTWEDDPLSTLIRLFLIGVPVELDKLRTALGPMEPPDWIELGLIDVEILTNPWPAASTWSPRRPRTARTQPRKTSSGLSCPCVFPQYFPGSTTRQPPRRRPGWHSSWR